MDRQLEVRMRKLKLGGLAKDWRSVQFCDPEQYLSDLLDLELKERDANRINRMVKMAGFSVVKTLDDFVWDNGIVELPNGLTQHGYASS
jgi:hypothetical protein